MILAQLLPEMVKGVNGWLISAGALLWITNELFKLNKNVKGKPGDPPNEQLKISHENLAERVDRHDEEIDAIQARIEHNLEEQNRQASIRTRNLYIHIEKLVGAIDVKVDAMPERLLNMLKNIKDLGSRS